MTRNLASPDSPVMMIATLSGLGVFHGIGHSLLGNAEDLRSHPAVADESRPVADHPHLNLVKGLRGRGELAQRGQQAFRIDVDRKEPLCQLPHLPQGQLRLLRHLARGVGILLVGAREPLAESGAQHAQTGQRLAQ